MTIIVVYLIYHENYDTETLTFCQNPSCGFDFDEMILLSTPITLCKYFDIL